MNKPHKIKFAGIDFGSQLAGTTAISFVENEVLTVKCSEKKSSADKFLIQQIEQYAIATIYIDAPLSLPKAYYNNEAIEKGSDFHYRSCDRLLKAMSPMFLGGLTARAMALQHQLKPVSCQEVYPAALVRHLSLSENYEKKKKTPDSFLITLQNHLPYPITNTALNWHEVDSLLAWLSGWRHQTGMAQVIGDKKEGVIII